MPLFSKKCVFPVFSVWYGRGWQVGLTGWKLTSFPGLRATFGCMKERGGRAMFPHVCDVEGRKVVKGFD